MLINFTALKHFLQFWLSHFLILLYWFILKYDLLLSTFLGSWNRLTLIYVEKRRNLRHVVLLN